MPGIPFQKGERLVGRAKGVPNKRTVEVRGVIQAAARKIGGEERLIAWIKESPQNESLFWTVMYIRLLPVRVQGTGEHGEIELSVKIGREELSRKLEERGLRYTRADLRRDAYRALPHAG
jgi:hypothetical protein